MDCSLKGPFHSKSFVQQYISTQLSDHSNWTSLAFVVSGTDEEAEDYQDQLKQMLRDLTKEKDKDVDKPLPLMDQVLLSVTPSTINTSNVHLVETHQFIPSLVLQREFIQFCKTLYSMFHNDPEENDLFQAIATVTSLVLQIGEASHRGQAKGSEVSSQEEAETAGWSQAAAADGELDGGPAAENEWTISYAQILASLLTEPALVSFFEKPLDLSARIAEAKEKQYQQRGGLLSVQQRSR